MSNGITRISMTSRTSLQWLDCRLWYINLNYKKEGEEIRKRKLLWQEVWDQKKTFDRFSLSIWYPQSAKVLEAKLLYKWLCHSLTMSISLSIYLFLSFSYQNLSFCLISLYRCFIINFHIWISLSCVPWLLGTVHPFVSI